MNKDIFLKELITFIADNSTKLNPTIFKKKIRFGNEKEKYSEIEFEYSNNFNGFSLSLSSYNKEICNFSTQKVGDAFLESMEGLPKSYQNLIFTQSSISSSHYYNAFPIVTHDYDYGIIHLEDDDTIFSNILRNLENNHFKFIQEIEIMSPNVLDYIVRFPSCFSKKSLVIFFVIEKNKLSIQNEKVKALFDYDRMVLENKNKLFSPFDLIFGRNKLDQMIKKKILGTSLK